MDTLLKNLEERMETSLEALRKEFASIRTGRANPALLDAVMVDAYGSKMPLNQVGTVSVPDARMLSVQVWDKGMIKDVERAIIDAGLGINPITEGELIRLPMPDLSEERRRELAKMAAKTAEGAKVAVRNIRRDGMDAIKKMEKDKEISEDDMHRASTKIQELTDKYVAQVDTACQKKEQDIMQL